jgi:hypothetical protein
MDCFGVRFSQQRRRRIQRYAPARPRAGPWHVVQIDGTPIRGKARKDYQKVLRDLQKARGEQDQFHSQDKPRYEQWLNRTFGALLTEVRELMSKAHELEFLIHEVQQEFYFGGHHSIARAYQAVMYRREHPEVEEKASNEFSEDPHEREQQKKEDEDFEDFLKDFFEEAQEKHEQARAHFDIPPSKRPEPPPGSRLKDLYRTLVRKLHPDKAADFDQKKREWWHQVQEAYEKGDAEQLEVILTLCEIDEKGLSKDTSVSILVRITQQFKHTLRSLRRELKTCQSHPAWNFSQHVNFNGFERHIRETLESESRGLRHNIETMEMTVSRWEELARSSARTRRRPRKAAYRDQEFF